MIILVINIINLINSTFLVIRNWLKYKRNHITVQNRIKNKDNKIIEIQIRVKKHKIHYKK